MFSCHWFLHIGCCVTVISNTADVFFILLCGMFVTKIASSHTKKRTILFADCVKLQILNKEFLQRTFGQVGHDCTVFVGHEFPHTGDFPSTFNSFALRNNFADHTMIKHVFSCELSCCHHVVVTTFCSKVMLAHKTHSITRYQTALGMWNFHNSIFCTDSHIT